METLKRYISPNAVVAVVIFVAITVTQTSFLSSAVSTPPRSTKNRKKSASYGQKPISDSKINQLAEAQNNKPIRRDRDGQIRDFQ